MDDNICRLCFNLVKNGYEVIDISTRRMLEVLSLKMDLDASKDPIVCMDCVGTVKRTYFFKTACIRTEELILSYADKAQAAGLDIKDVYKDSINVKIELDEDINVCRFCMNQRCKKKCVSIDVLTNDAIYVEMSIFMPKMVLDVIEDPVICTSCKENLDGYFKFARTCLGVEEKINKYRQSEGTNDTSRIKLSNVLYHLFKDILVNDDQSNEKSVIKREVEQNLGLEIQNEQIKCEALDIKDEERILPKYNELLKRHELKHKIIADIKKHKCRVCDYQTRYKNNLKTHMLRHKPLSELEIYKCEKCTYESIYLASIRKHVLTHKDRSELEMYECAICNWETKYKHNLKVHMQRHTELQKEMYRGWCTFDTKYENPKRDELKRK